MDPSTSDDSGRSPYLNTRVIIAAAGPQKYWNNYLGVRSHLAPIPKYADMPLIAYTLSMAGHTFDDVIVTVPIGGRVQFIEPISSVCKEFPAVREVTAMVAVQEAPNEYLSSRRLWNTDGRTILLLGDVYFSRSALYKIASDTYRGYRVYGRYGHSSITGTPYGEIFAVSIYPEQHARIDAALKHLGDLFSRKRLRRFGGWELLRYLQGTPVSSHQVTSGYFVEINDETDDIDKPEDWDRHPMMGAYRDGKSV